MYVVYNIYMVNIDIDQGICINFMHGVLDVEQNKLIKNKKLLKQER